MSCKFCFHYAPLNTSTVKNMQIFLFWNEITTYQGTVVAKKSNHDESVRPSCCFRRLISWFCLRSSSVLFSEV